MKGEAAALSVRAQRCQSHYFSTTPCTSNKMQRYTVYYIWKLLYMFRLVSPPIIRSANNCICSIWYLLHRCCYLLLSWRVETGLSVLCCVVGSAYATYNTTQHTQTSFNTSTIAAGSSNRVTNTRWCRYSCLRSWWWVVIPPKTCNAFSRYNKLCNVASCWICIRTLYGDFLLTVV